MHVIIARNVNEAYCRGAALLQREGHHRASRNGDVLVMAHPVSTLYHRPRERVLYDVRRDANPFLHLYDALWCLAGRFDVAWLAQLAAKMADFSDDGRTLHGAYGYRWRQAQGVDQLHEIIRMLDADPTTRRAVLQMWDASADLGSPSRDIPCNLMVHFQHDEGHLNITVFNRSNDMIWGAYGANAVQFSVLQEYVASACGWEVGWYEQVSANFHAYLPVWDKHLAPVTQGDPVQLYFTDPYERGIVVPYPMVQTRHDVFDRDLDRFMAWGSPSAHPDIFERDQAYENPFFPEVAVPMLRAWRAHKRKDGITAYQCANAIKASDWALACQQWLGRRYS